MKKQYFQMMGRSSLLNENIEDKRKRHDMEAVAIYKDLSVDNIKKGLDQLRN